MIAENLEYVRKKIEESCKKAGRPVEEVTLIAVSKTKPVEDLLEAITKGNQTVFGENKVQELGMKQEALASYDLKWHMIGHLQRNKVKYLIGNTELIHSVDSLRLAQEIESESAKKNVETNVLIEVNMAEEDSKFGVTGAGAEALIREIAAECPHVKIKGLMTIAPYVEDPEENRPIFRAMKKLFVDIDKKNIDNVSMQILSMGMTGDYCVAVEEGATMVRVGTGIFGDRNYS